MSVTLFTVGANDYEVKIPDPITGEYISLAQDGFCGVFFNKVGSADLNASTVQLGDSDGVVFGREFMGATSWTITGNAFSPGSAVNAWNNYSRIARAWTAYPERLQARSTVPLIFKRPGRDTMCVYGRPNRIDPDTTNSYKGLITFQASFRQSDPLFYTAIQKTVTIAEGTPYVGGMAATTTKDAFILPFQMSASDPTLGNVENDGDASTSPIIVISGACTNPKVQYTGPDGTVQWSFQLNLTIPENDYVVIDTRASERSITNSQGASWAGAFTGVSRLQDVTIMPGSGRITYNSTSVSGSTCVITYMDAWLSI